MNPSSTGTSRSVYQIRVAASDTEQAKTAVARIFCSDSDHAPPCPVPWESSSTAGGGSVQFVFYATDGQAHEIFAEVSTQGFSEVRLFTSAGDDGQPIDGSTVIEQFQLERDFPES